MFNLPNLLTLFRLALLPLIILLLFIPASWAAAVALTLYVLGAVTDWLDGYVARKYNQVTEFGTFMDPISDKIYVVTIMLTLVATDRIAGIWVVLVLAILVREFLISGLREYLGPKNIKVPVSDLAKWKTAAQMVATGLLIIAPYMFGGYVLGILALFGATALTLYTAWDYMKAGWAHMKSDLESESE
ncbi:MAG: CDP-diacylglycerol--glycerol-3-phosphate 3-phosphatidyltransferase [Alphaproteobacteria bacterium]|nr:CDP-diacylglycerol--glycerol-3-phosphate 3-phosphatidyltransferase [Alphaproteobacteria bacterium]